MTLVCSLRPLLFVFNSITPALSQLKSRSPYLQPRQLNQVPLLRQVSLIHVTIVYARLSFGGCADESPFKWSVAQVRFWVKSIGLGQFATAFGDNEIDGGALAVLTEKQLIGMIPQPSYRTSLLAARGKLFRNHRA